MDLAKSSGPKKPQRSMVATSLLPKLGFLVEPALKLPGICWTNLCPNPIEGHHGVFNVTVSPFFQLIL